MSLLHNGVPTNGCLNNPLKKKDPIISRLWFVALPYNYHTILELSRRLKYIIHQAKTSGFAETGNGNCSHCVTVNVEKLVSRLFVSDLGLVYVLINCDETLRNEINNCKEYGREIKIISSQIYQSKIRPDTISNAASAHVRPSIRFATEVQKVTECQPYHRDIRRISEI